MRSALGAAAVLLASTLLGPTPARGQLGPGVKGLLEAYEKMSRDPAYDFLAMKNMEGEVIRSARSGGAFAKAGIELAEKRLAAARARGLYGEMSSTWVINDLAEAYRAAGRHDKEVAVVKEYADWCAREYGPRNTETRMALGKLVQAHLNARDEEKALAVFDKAFAGDKGPSEAKLQMLGTVLQHHLTTRNYDKVFETARQIVRMQAELKQADPAGPFSPYRQNIAYMLIQAKRKDLAEKLLDDAWERSLKENGPEAAETIAALKRNAGDYLAVGPAEKAVSRFEELARLLAKTAGSDHADTLTARQKLASAHLWAKDTDKALKLLKELHATTKEKLGVEHPLTGQVVLDLGNAMEAAKEYGQAEPYLRENVEIQKKVSKADDAPAVTGAMALLGTNLMKQGKWAEAEKVLRQTLEVRRKKSPQDWTTNNTESLLGEALLGLKRYEDAEPLLQAGHKGLVAKRYYIPYMVQTQRLNEAVERLIRLYEATDKPARAAEYRKMLLKK